MAFRLEYALALDRALAWLLPADSHLLAVLSSTTFADLLLDRAKDPMELWCSAAAAARAHQRLADGTLPTELAAASYAALLGETRGTGRLASIALWATPDRVTWPETLSWLNDILGDQARLAILAGTRAGGVLGLARRSREPGEPEPVAEAVRRALVRRGWQVSTGARLGGARSMTWAIAARLASAARRPDLADRAERGHHDSLTHGWWASYEVLLASRTTSER